MDLEENFINKKEREVQDLETKILLSEDEDESHLVLEV